MSTQVVLPFPAMIMYLIAKPVLHVVNCHQENRYFTGIRKQLIWRWFCSLRKVTNPVDASRRLETGPFPVTRHRPALAHFPLHPTTVLFAYYATPNIATPSSEPFSIFGCSSCLTIFFCSRGYHVLEKRKLEQKFYQDR